MLIRRICFSISKSHHTPFPISPILTNPFPNSQSYSIRSRNFETLKSRFRRTISANSHTPVAVNITTDAGRVEVFRSLEDSLGSKFSSEPIAPNPNPQIIVFSGPSGVGKDAVIKRLREVRKDLHFVVTATSRAKRPGEIDGKDYFFISKDEFLSMIEKNEFLEYALVYGDYKGVPKKQISDYMAKGCDIVLRVDIQGASTLRRILKDSAIFVFLVAESEEALVKRLIGRKTESKEALLTRVASAKEELKHLNEFDYVVVNKEGDLESSVEIVGSIIDAEKAKVHQRRAAI
ncbi:hypothetical protein ABFS83_07G024800 [Erythranthe nasuta]